MAEIHFHRYQSIGELLDAARGSRSYYHEGSPWREHSRHALEWCGGAFCLEACDRVVKGTAVAPEVMAEAHKILDKVDASFRDRESMQWTPDVVGAYPVVPEFLMGMPENMRHRQSVEDDRAPLKIYVEVAYSAGVSQAAITKRGTALAALAMRLAEERPVEFCAFVAWQLNTVRNEGIVWTVPIATAPMGLSEVMNVIASTMFARPINFNATSAAMLRQSGESPNKYERFGWVHEGCTDAQRAEKLREFMGLSESDIIVTRGYLTDEAELMRDPVEWVHKQLDRQRSLG